MRLSRQSQIAIGILVACARLPDDRIQTQQAADMAGATKDHTAQVVALLVRVGFLVSQRGRNGGLCLPVTPDRIPLGAVLRYTEPDLASVDHLGRSVQPRNLPVFDTIVKAALLSYIHLMDHFTISDLISSSGSDRIACLDCSLLNPARRHNAAETLHPLQQASRLANHVEPLESTWTPDPRARKRSNPPHSLELDEYAYTANI
jgi:Rrf2 family nitric oxide-sensitive transcriptional repressor